MDPLLVETILGLHAVSTLLMAGLIWTIQIVHYPLFALVGTDAFQAYEGAHTRRITWLVAPLMLVEAGSAVALLYVLSDGLPQTLALIGIGLLLVNWVSTAALQAPCHTQLCRAYDERLVHRLVNTNWIRTVCWSLRGALAIALLRVVN